MHRDVLKTQLSPGMSLAVNLSLPSKDSGWGELLIGSDADWTTH